MRNISSVNLAEQVLEKVCQQVYGKSIDQLLKPWGEVNRLPHDGLKAFSSKLVYNCTVKIVSPEIMEVLIAADQVLHGYSDTRKLGIIKKYLVQGENSN